MFSYGGFFFHSTKFYINIYISRSKYYELDIIHVADIKNVP